MSNGLSNLRIEYENSATINIGDFQNVKPLFRVSADVDNDVHPTTAKERLKALVDQWLEDKVTEIRKELAE